MAGIFHRISQHFEQAARERDARQAARDAYVAAISQLAAPGADVPALVATLPDAQTAQLSPEELSKVNSDAFLQLATAYLDDDRLSQEEERVLFAAGAALGVDAARLAHDFPALLARLIVAQVNDGRLPVLQSSDIILQKGEVAHISAAATLLKWQTIREWKGGSSGFSFHVMKGVTYRTGRTRGHLVDAGQKLVAEDVGHLTITSKRAVFTGSRRTLQFAYPKLVDVQVFTDGIRLAVSNRQKPSTFKLTAPDTVAAVINAAAQKLM